MAEPHHSRFTLDRILPAGPDLAFRFWSEPRLKQRWNSCHPDWRELEIRNDFRLGGHDYSLLRDPERREHAIDMVYLDIVRPERIVYAYSMRIDDAPLSASLVTVRFSTHPRGTLMRYDEHLTMLDGSEGAASRERGTGHGFDRLVAALEAAAATLQ